jgi:phosphoribosylformylglycinamidine synthase PurS subunit
LLWNVEARVILKNGVLDAPGQVINTSLHKLGFGEVKQVRMGKHITMLIDGPSREHVEKRVRDMGAKLLSNPVIEDFEFELSEAKTPVSPTPDPSPGRGISV